MQVKVKAYPNLKRTRPYLWNLGEAFSQFIASIFGLNCNLTFSAYCGYWQEKGWPIVKHLHKPINLLFWNSEHCSNAWKERT